MSEWAFLIDENLPLQTAAYLRKEDLHAEHVTDNLFEGADDERDVLPYARKHDLIVVTNDVKDFSDLDSGDHRGVVIVYDGTTEAFEIAAGLVEIVDTYEERDSLRGYAILDDWL